MQRLEVYQKQKTKAEEEQNSSKARRMGRIVKQYHEAIKDHQKGKPIPVEDLPTPPGNLLVYFLYCEGCTLCLLCCTCLPVMQGYAQHSYCHKAYFSAAVTAAASGSATADRNDSRERHIARNITFAVDRISFFLMISREVEPEYAWVAHAFFWHRLPFCSKGLPKPKMYCYVLLMYCKTVFFPFNAAKLFL